MKNLDRIQSHEQLKSLCGLLEWANASDADDTARPPTYACQYAHGGSGARFGFYGHIWEAILLILDKEGGILRDALPDPNFGGNASWYEDLMIAVDGAKYTVNSWFDRKMS